MEPTRILVVEDEGIIAADLAARLERLGHVVVDIAASADEAFASASSTKPDLILMDIVLQGPQTGISAAKRIRDALGTPIVFVTSHGDAATVHSALGAEPFGYVLKPFNERELQTAIGIALYRHRAESKLLKMERWLAATLSSIGDAVIATDVSGHVTLMNPVAERLTGWGADEALGQPLEAVFPAVDAVTREALVGLVQRALIEGFTIGIDEHVVLLSREGAEVPIDDSVAPIRDDHGHVSGVVVVFRDASARHLAEAAMRSLSESLERQVQARTGALATANRAMTAFSASVSHDLRAPLMAVKGLSSLLSERYSKVLDAEGLKFLDILKAKSHQMERMVDDFLRLFRLRQEPLRNEVVHSQSMVADLVRAIQDGSAHTVSVLVDPLPDVTGDSGLIRQVWANVLTNAAKFTSRSEHPQIHVGATVLSLDDKQMVQFRVTDNGVGFDNSHAEGIFDMYRRLHPDAEFEGQGIGLAVVQTVIERHGGQVRAEGKPGQGAVISFSLPIELASVA